MKKLVEALKVTSVTNSGNMADKREDDQRGRHNSLVTRSEAAASSGVTRLSEAQKKTELAKLRATQATRAAEAQAQLARYPVS